MSIVTPIFFQKTYRFEITLYVKGAIIAAASGPTGSYGGALGEHARDGKKLSVGIESIVWSGRDLLLSRGMREDPSVSLIRELIEVDDIRLTMFAANAKPSRQWKIEHEGMRDRGFDFMHAARDENAREVVAILNASMHRVDLGA